MDATSAAIKNTRVMVPFPASQEEPSQSLITVRIPSAFFARMMSIPPVIHHVYPMCVDRRLVSLSMSMVSKGLIDWLHTYGAFARCTIEVPVQSPACERRRDEVQGEVDHQKWHHHSPSYAERHRCKCNWPLIAWWWCSNRLPEMMITAANYKQLWRLFRSFGALNKDN